jgi:MFS family permease
MALGADRDGAALPATTALMSHASERSVVGETMGVAQTFAGLSRVVAPLIATSAFQRFGSPAPFYIAGTIVMLVGAMAFRLDVAPHALRQKGAG